MMDRRNFLKALGAGGLAVMSGIPAKSWGANAKVVVIGGGTGGATAAKYLKLADPTLDVTVIEKSPDYYTCYMSNEVLGGGRTLDSLKFGYDGLRARGITVVHEDVVGINAERREILTRSGNAYAYDRCIVSPGIDFRYELIDGYNEEMAATTLPHAWKAGSQTTLLRSQLEAMPDGGTFVMSAPPNPYRCPPAPYERASQVAYYFKQYKPNSKVIIVDPKSSFAKQSLFMQGWMDLYNYGSDNAMIEWVSGESVIALDKSSNTVVTDNGERFTGSVLNIIPPQKAGALAFGTDLTDSSGWCPVAVKTFESTRYADIHVIGDACAASPLPKSGFAANSEGKACALAVAALLNGREPGRTSFTNGCYSLVGDDYAISIVAVYRLSEDGSKIAAVQGAGGMTPSDATDQDKLIDVQYAYSWYNNFTRDVFL